MPGTTADRIVVLPLHAQDGISVNSFSQNTPAVSAPSVILSIFRIYVVLLCRSAAAPPGATPLSLLAAQPTPTGS